MHQLGYRAAADRADVVSLVADGIQHRLVAVEQLLVAADPDCQVAGARPARPAADRSVQHIDALLGVKLVDAADDRGGVGAEVKVNLAGAQALQHSLLAQGHRLHLHRAGERGKDHFGGLGHFPGSVGPDGAGLQVGRGRLPPQVVDNQLIAALQTVVGHTAAHSSQSDKSNLHNFLQ